MVKAPLVAHYIPPRRRIFGLRGDQSDAQPVTGWPSETEFLHGSVMLLMGEPGCGKSSFLLEFGRYQVQSLRSWLSTRLTRLVSRVVPWIPVFVALRDVRASDFKGLLLKLLRRLPAPVDTVLSSTEDLGVNILLLLDGLDEVQSGCLEDPISAICEGVPIGRLRIIATCREGKHRSLVTDNVVLSVLNRWELLPFDMQQVLSIAFATFSCVKACLLWCVLSLCFSLTYLKS